MSEIIPQRPILGVCALVVKDNKLLLGKRISKKGLGDGTYALPGGKVDFMESPEDAVLRELLEESGQKGTVVRYAGLSNDRFLKINEHYVTLYYVVVTDDEPKVMEPDKCSAWEYFSLNNLPKNLFCDILPTVRATFNL